MTFLQIFLSYLLGSIPSSIIAGKRRGIDIREHGSGNAGGTNTFRVLGWKAGLIVTIADIAKGYIAATLVADLAEAPDYFSHEMWQITCGFAAIIGHIWTIFAGFRGGKGVATAAGLMFGLYPMAMAVAVVIFGAIIFLTGYVSLASIIALNAVPFILIASNDNVSNSLLILSISIGLLIILTHKENIKRLRNGTEAKVSKSKKKIS